MKNLVSVLALFACVSLCYAQEGSIRMINSTELTPESHVTFTKVVTHTTITVESEHGIVSEIELPRGAHYSVQVLRKDQPGIDEDPFRKTFEGDVVIRVQRDEAFEIGRDGWESMLEAPFQLALNNVKVTINDNIKPGYHPNN